MSYEIDPVVEDGERRQTLKSLIRTCIYLSIKYFPALAEVDIGALRDNLRRINEVC